MFGPQPPAVSASDGDTLARLAVEAIRQCLSGAPADNQWPATPALQRVGCSFVTIENAGRLRGCIGSLRPIAPLCHDVVRNARRATTDPRMSPVSAGEWPMLSISVSVLGSAEPLPARNLPELHRWLQPHLDGLIIGVGEREVTFLPTVWVSLPDPVQFVAALLAKGGWPADRLPRGAALSRYAATVFHAAGGPGEIDGSAEVVGAVPR